MKYLDPNSNLTQDQFKSDFIAQTCIDIGLNNVDKLHQYNTLMQSEYYPETYDTPLLSNVNISKYSVLIGSGMWAVTPSVFLCQA